MFRTLIYCFLLIGLPGARATSVYSFDSDAVGTSTPFTDTSNGISATFATGGPEGFAVFPTFFSALTGNVLLNPGPVTGLVLPISFSQELSDISLDFAIADVVPTDTLTIRAFQGNTLVGSTSTQGTIPPGFMYPEGVAAFSGAVFNSVLLSSTGDFFAVDNISVDPSTSTPEPGTIPVVALGTLAGVVIVHRRGRRAAA